LTGYFILALEYVQEFDFDTKNHPGFRFLALKDILGCEIIKGVAKDGKGREEGSSWLGYRRAEEIVIYSAKVR
jgi:hypothetical protein